MKGMELRMKDIFLTIKAWQLFALIFIIPMSILLGLILTIQATKTTSWIVVLIPLIVLASVGCLLGWFWQVGVATNEKVSEQIRMESKYFQFGIQYVAGYLILLALIPIIAGLGIVPPAVFFLMVPLHLLAMGVMFYSLYFVSKSLVMAEQQRAVTLSDYIGQYLRQKLAK